MTLLLCIMVSAIVYFGNIFSYSMGVRHGRIVKNNGIPNINPLQVIKDNKYKKEEKIKHDEFAEGLKNVLSFGNE